MIRITVLCVGRIKERFFTEAVNEYKKRLSGYVKLSIIEVKDEPTKENPTDTQRKEILDKEGTRLLAKLPDKARKIALAIDGKELSSEKLAKSIEDYSANGVSDFCFIIGGSIGLSENVLNACDMKLSFSKMTFPHQLMRIILLEQLYRSFRIINGAPYHK